MQKKTKMKENQANQPNYVRDISATITHVLKEFFFLQFRGVVNPIDIDLKNYLIKLGEHNNNADGITSNESVHKDKEQQVHCERLQKVANGVFYNENVRVNSEENSTILKRILKENITLNMKNKDE